MTNYPIVRFVDEVGSFTPRVGLNEDDLVVLHDGFTLGAPTLEVDDPFAVGVELGSRKVEGTLRVRGDGESAAMYLQAFAREVLRTSSVLMFQFDPGSEPMWLRTYLSEPQALDFANAVAGAARGETTFTLPWSLTADPHAYGPLESVDVDLTNNPAGVASSVTTMNLCPNPSAEASVSGWTASAGSVTRSTFIGVPSGGYAFMVSGPSVTVSQASGWRCAVAAAERFSPSVWVASSDPRTARLRVRWMTAGTGGTQVGSIVWGPATPIPAEGGTIDLAGLTVPASATAAEIGIEFSAGAGVVMWDAVMASPTATPRPYADGDTAGWTWTGARHLSTSGPLTSVSTSASHITLPAIKGDAPAPCRIELTPSVSLARAAIMAKVAAYDEPGADVAPVVVDLDETGVVSGIGAQVSAAGYIGTGYRETTAAAATGQWAVTTRPGSYHAFLAVQVAPSAAAATWTAALFSDLATSTTPLGSQGIIRWNQSIPAERRLMVDLGVVSLPVRAGIPDPSASSAPTDFVLRLNRAAGTGQVRIDALVLVPHDAARIDGRVTTQTVVVTPDASSPGPDVTAVVDPGSGFAGSSWLQADDGIRSGIPSPRGGPLLAHPAADNVLTLLLQTSGESGLGNDEASSAPLTATTTVRVSYYPRYVWLSTGL